MKYYSEETKKLYDTFADLTEAEAKVKADNKAQAEAKETLDSLLDALLDDAEYYLEQLKEYNEKYGAYTQKIGNGFDSVIAAMLSGIFH